MARQESDREDLMREATALVVRAEFDVPHEPENVVAGYRRDGSLSIYFGADPCVHFDSQMRLRRAFIDGELYRTQAQTLARLVRVRDAQSVTLLRHDLTPEELKPVLDRLAQRLELFRHALASDCRCVEVIPPQTDVRLRLVDSLTSVTSGLVLAPAIAGKR